VSRYSSRSSHIISTTKNVADHLKKEKILVQPLIDSFSYNCRYPTAVSGSFSNNKKFSPCSITNITTVLAAKGSCFSASATGFCGDYVVSPANGEKCDVGPLGDACCYGNSVATPCKFKPPAVCSNTTDICCTG
jgi:hypothetical protein